MLNGKNKTAKMSPTGEIEIFHASCIATPSLLFIMHLNWTFIYSSFKSNFTFIYSNKEHICFYSLSIYFIIIRRYKEIPFRRRIHSSRILCHYFGLGTMHAYIVHNGTQNYGNRNKQFSTSRS